MKLFVISLLLLTACLFTGCISEDNGSCPPELQNNLILQFLNPDNKPNSKFTDFIGKVDVFIYDSQNRLIKKKSVEEKDLNYFAGIQLNLAPGTYRVVCWANSSDHSTYEQVLPDNLLSDASLCNSNVDVDYTANNCDPLYYAPATEQAFMVTVPSRGVKTEKIDFASAHACIEVYIKGFQDQPTYNNIPPIVRLTDVALGYNFERQPLDQFISYQGACNNQILNEESLFVIYFNTPLFNEDVPSLLQIRKQSSTEILTTVCIKDFIRDNNISLTDNKQVVIPILIEYKSVGVSIGIPGWKQNSVTPGI